MFRIIFFLLFIATVHAQNEKYTEKPIPTWIKLKDPLVSINSMDKNSKMLLRDSQKNLEEKTIYEHTTYRILTPVDVRDHASLSIDFDPSYQQLVIHNIRINRAGKWIDKRDSFHVLNQENLSDPHSYNCGSLTLTYLLEDIRIGDIIDYSYSLVGENSFYPYLSNARMLQFNIPVEHVFFRIIGSKEYNFQTKFLNRDTKLTISDVSPVLKEWVWEDFKVPAHTKEHDEPVWSNPKPMIILSLYKNWNELVKKLIPIYRLDDNFAQTSSLEMKALVKKWMGSSNNPLELALKAVRFVQDEIRYVSIESSTHLLNPYDPNTVLKRRFGDCKDKTFLLHALLYLMGIESKPILVNYINPKVLSDVIPSECLFNHVALQIKIGDEIFYVDSTLSHQGGSLSENYFPNFEWGLLLSEGTDKLISLPNSSLKRPIEVESSFIFVSKDLADYKIETSFYGLKADALRLFFDENSKEVVAKERFSKIKKAFKKAKCNSYEFSDDRENNIFKTIESYSVNTIENKNVKELPFFSDILGKGLNYISSERSVPCALKYPLWVTEHIRIENPFNSYSHFKSTYENSNEAIFFNFSTNRSEKNIEYHLELKHLKDHISKDALRSYYKIINDIEDEIPTKIIIFEGDN